MTDSELDNAAPTHAGTRIERISTGALPSDEEVRTVVTDGYEQFRSLEEGTVATYIPALAQASPSAFGVCVAGARGGLFAIGDAELEFSIQSISKIFVFASICETIGPEEARRSSVSTAPDSRLIR